MHTPRAPTLLHAPRAPTLLRAPRAPTPLHAPRLPMSHAPCSPPDSNEQLEQWPDLLYTGTDTFAFNTAPVRDASMASAAFFITWVFLSYFCMNNMIAGVVAENFIQISEEQKGSALLTAEQRQWVRRSLQPMLPPSVPCAVRRTHAAAHAFARVAPADSAHASRAVSPLLLLLDLLLDPPPPPPAKVLTIERTAGVMPAVRYVPPSRWRRLPPRLPTPSPWWPRACSTSSRRSAASTRSPSRRLARWWRW